MSGVQRLGDALVYLSIPWRRIWQHLVCERWSVRARESDRASSPTLHLNDSIIFPIGLSVYQCSGRISCEAPRLASLRAGSRQPGSGKVPVGGRAGILRRSPLEELGTTCREPIGSGDAKANLANDFFSKPGLQLRENLLFPIPLQFVAHAGLQDLDTEHPTA